MKIPSGSVKKKNGRWLARISWTDEYGKRRERTEYVDSKTDGLDKVGVWRREWQETGRVSPPGKIRKASHSFEELSTYYEEHYAIAPTVRDGKKLEGQKSWRTTRGHVKHLREQLGDVALHELSWEDVDVVRKALLKGKTHKGSPRTVAYVNRVLSTLRRMLKVARQKKWMTSNPFAEGDVLIQRAHEQERQTIVTPEMEAVLVSLCTPPNGQGKRLHLRAMSVLAIETGMRTAEILQLTPEQIDWQRNVITVISTHTKTEEGRVVPMSARLREELLGWWKLMPPKAKRVFGTKNVPRGAWESLRAEASRQIPELAGLHFHDLRHTAASRMIAAGVPEAQVGRVLGHRVAQTTRRYVNVDVATAREVGRKIDRKARRAAPRKRKEPEVPAEVM